MKRILTKPCARADRGCEGQVEALTPSELRERLYCSRSCAVRARMEAGWQPQRGLTAEARHRGGVAGGSIAGAKHRARVMRVWLERTRAQIPESVAQALGPQEVRRLQVLLARTARKMWRAGYHACHARLRAQRQRRRTAA